jgi:hypothetical protein
MDYEVFLVSRMREDYVHTRRARGGRADRHTAVGAVRVHGDADGEPQRDRLDRAVAFRDEGREDGEHDDGGGGSCA